jgi:phospholipid/cholesterol/gamma-HCH transport system substrate-binding protein
VADTVLYKNIRNSLLQLQNATAAVSQFTSNLKTTSEKLNQKDNAVGVLLNDPATGNSVKTTLENMAAASKKLDEDLEALQHNFLLRGFFRKKAKAEAKAAAITPISQQ